MWQYVANLDLMSHVVRQVTSLSNSNFLSRDIDVLSHDSCVWQPVNNLFINW